MRKEHSIKQKLSLSYVLYILLFILFVGFLSNFVIQRQYRSYAERRQVSHISQILGQLSNQYMDSWNVDNLELIGSYEINNGYIITIYNNDGQKIWSAEEHHTERCHMELSDIKNRMLSQNPNWDGEYVENDFPLEANNEQVGYAKIGYYSPYFYSQEDFSFLMKLNTLYLLLSLFFIVLALILGAYMAKRLSNPLRKVVKATSNISKGIYQKIPSDRSNITEINQLTTSINLMTESLKNQELLRKQLTTDVTHELRTPLTTLQTHIEAMIDGLLKSDKKQLNNIYEEIIRLNAIVKDLDKLLYYDKETIALNKEKLNISEMVLNVVSIFKAAYLKKNVELTYELKDVYLSVDKDKMHQVMINILSNALKYTPSGKRVFIQLVEEKNDVVIKIEDEGIGIDEEDLPHIFERFYRADKSRDRKTGGAGIGLAIVKSIIQAHKGTIIAESKISQGTQIIICLPKMAKE